MLFSLLFSNTLHFALMLITTFVFLSAALLYFDSWTLDRSKRTYLARSIGFLFLALAADVPAAHLNVPLLLTVLQFVKVFGLTITLASFIEEPTLSKPSKKAVAAMVPFLSLPFYHYVFFPLTSLLFFFLSMVCFFRVVESLEKELRPVALAMFFLGLNELMQVGYFWVNTSNVFLSKVLAEFGPYWFAQQLVQALGIIIFAFWIWGYIRFRLELQLFISTAALSLFVFFLSSVYFTFLLLKNIEMEALSYVETDLSVLAYSLTEKQKESLTQAHYLANIQRIQKAVSNEDRKALALVAESFVTEQRIDSLIIASTSGTVLYRSEDNDKRNDNIAENKAFKAALQGEGVFTFAVRDGTVAPQIFVQAITPIYSSGDKKTPASGVIVASFSLDNAFVDGIKKATNLDTSLFGMDKRAATTFISLDGKSRYIGSLESNKNIVEQVLHKGESYTGETKIFQQSFYSAYAPLSTFDGETIGMLSVSSPQSRILEAARKAINDSFTGSLLFVLLSQIPAYFFARFLKENIEA